MPKRMKRTKKASEATKNKVYNSYYNFIDFMGLDEYSPDFTLNDVVEWMATDSGATKGDDKYKVVAYVAVAMAKTWRNLGLTRKIDDDEYEAIDFNYDLGDGDSYNDSEWKGVKDVDDSYFRDYGMRDMSFPKIDDSYDNYEEGRKLKGRKMLRERWREGKDVYEKPTDYKKLETKMFDYSGLDWSQPITTKNAILSFIKSGCGNDWFRLSDAVNVVYEIGDTYYKQIINEIAQMDSKSELYPIKWRKWFGIRETKTGSGKFRSTHDKGTGFGNSYDDAEEFLRDTFDELCETGAMESNHLQYRTDPDDRGFYDYEMYRFVK